MQLSAENSLITRAKRFDHAALAEIYDSYSPGIYRYAMRLLGDPDLAKECMAETFSRFLNAIQRGVGPNIYLQAYLYRISHNWITDYYRSKPTATLPMDQQHQFAPIEDPHQLVTNAMEIKQLRQALAELTPDQRQAVTLKYMEEWSNEDIARAMKKPIGAVKALQHRAIKTLRRLLDQQIEMEYDSN